MDGKNAVLFENVVIFKKFKWKNNNNEDICIHYIVRVGIKH